MSTLKEDAQTYELDVDDEGPYTEQITGWKIAACEAAEVFLLIDNRVIVYAPEDYIYNDVSDDPATALRDFLLPDDLPAAEGYVETYADAMGALCKSRQAQEEESGVTAGAFQSYLLDLIDDDGCPYSGRLTGARMDIVENVVVFFALEDGRYITYYPAEFRYENRTDELRASLQAELDKRPDLVERFKETEADDPLVIDI